jgi:hypothetical protein
MAHHAHSIDRWDDATGANLYEHARVAELEFDLATELERSAGHRADF